MINDKLTTEANQGDPGIFSFTGDSMNFVMYLLPLTVLSNIDRCVLVFLIYILDDLLHAFWNIIKTNKCSLEG
jgi:hypothetical protein